MASVNFQAPNEYSTELADIERRRKYAEMLRSQSMEPVQAPQTPAGGFAVPVSWTHGLAKALQGYNARKGLEAATADQKALGERYTSERGTALAAALRAGSGTPAQEGAEVAPDFPVEDAGAFQTQGTPAVPGNRSAMLAALVGSKFPDLQSAGLAQQMKEGMPVKLGPGDVYGVPGQPPMMAAPFKPEAPKTPTPKAPGTLRDRVSGDQTIQEELQADGTWKEVGKGPRFARQVTPVVVAGGGGGMPQKAPVGYRFSSDGETLEPIPGGPKDTSSRPLPTQALKLQQAEVDAISGAATINVDLASVREQIEKKKLDLSLFNNLMARGRNVIGVSDENSRNYATFKATLERLRNESLRLNKGVQTEGDAVRAWNELFENINDNGVVQKRLAEIEKTNERAIDLRKMNIDNIRINYGAEPLDVSAQRTQPSAIGPTPARRATDKLSPQEQQELDALRSRFGKK